MKSRSPLFRPALLLLCTPLLNALAQAPAVPAAPAPAAPAVPATPAAAESPAAVPGAPANETPAGPIGGDKFATDKERHAYALGVLLAAQQKQRMADMPDAPKPVVDDVIAGLRDVLTGQKSMDYALGTSFGGTIKRSEVEIEVEFLLDALRTSMTGGTTKLTPQESQQLVQQINQQTQARQQTKQKELAAKNLTEATAWLDKNSTADGVKKTESGVQYKIEKEGEGAVPGDTDIVTISYRGTVISGDEFERSPEGQPTKRPIRMLPKGVQEGLKLLKKGGKAKLWVPPSLGFGENKRGIVQPNSVLIYDVELIDSTPPPKPAVAPVPQDGRAPITATTPPVAVDIPAMQEAQKKAAEQGNATPAPAAPATPAAPAAPAPENK